MVYGSRSKQAAASQSTFADVHVRFAESDVSLLHITALVQSHFEAQGVIPCDDRIILVDNLAYRSQMTTEQEVGGTLQARRKQIKSGTA